MILWVCFQSKFQTFSSRQVCQGFPSIGLVFTQRHEAVYLLHVFLDWNRKLQHPVYIVGCYFRGTISLVRVERKKYLDMPS